MFYKVDRAARNLIDYVELERLESEHCVHFISVSQQTENSPAGRMLRHTLANMASFYTEQMAVDISQGINRRVQEGWFPGKAPYGYRNVRLSGRSVVEVDAIPAANVGRIYHLYAYDNHTLEGIVRKLQVEGAVYRPGCPRFSRTTIHNILNDRAYLGEIQYRGQWYPGQHTPLVDRSTWERVRALSGGGGHASHTMTYADDLIKCHHCGYRITGEVKVKNTKHGERSYHYYRCTYYNKSGHPRTRVTEAQLDQQVLDLFDKMRIEDERKRNWIRTALEARTRDDQQESHIQRAELLRQLTLLSEQKDRLLNLRIAGEIDPETYAAKQTQMRDREASLKLQLEGVDGGKAEKTELAGKVFELSQTLTKKWVTAELAVKRQILEIVLLNCTLHDVTLVPTIRKPFDMLVEGLLVPQSGGGGN